MNWGHGSLCPITSHTHGALPYECVGIVQGTSRQSASAKCHRQMHGVGHCQMPGDGSWMPARGFSWVALCASHGARKHARVGTPDTEGLSAECLPCAADTPSKISLSELSTLCRDDGPSEFDRRLSPSRSCRSVNQRLPHLGSNQRLSGRKRAANATVWSWVRSRMAYFASIPNETLTNR